MKKLILFLIIIIKLKIKAEELSYSINNRKSIRLVNDRFVSFSIDPAVLISALNISDATYKLARHLGPSFLRIAGPSTEFLEFTNNEEKVTLDSSRNGTEVFVTSKMWTELNEGLIQYNITPIFALNEKCRINKAWNPKSAFGFLDLSDKMNMSCYWQLGYECSNITEFQYKNDLMALRHIMDAFPRSRESWGIIGNDLNACSSSQNIESMKKQLSAMANVVDAVAFRPAIENFASISFTSKPMHTSPWAIAPSPDTHISFKSSILWAKQLGDAAVSGFEVVFRQPRLRELFHDTPAFWISLFHKKFMGRNVLEVKASNPYKNTYVYAHCSKRQHSFTRMGAMTVFVINDSPEEQKVALKIGFNPQYQNLEVQTYILTAPFDGSKDTFLNGVKLSMDDLQEDTVDFRPRFRRARLNRNKHLTIDMPPRSVGFFVLPGVRAPACIEREDELDLLLKEIYQDQNNNFLFGNHASAETETPKRITSLNDLYQKMLQELQSEEQFYDGGKAKEEPSKDQIKWTQMLVERANVEEQRKLLPGFAELKQPKTGKDAKKYIMERAKQMKAADVTVMKDNHGLKKILLDRALQNALKPIDPEEAKPLEFELSSQEIRTILHERARAHAAQKNIKITSEEIDALMKQAADKLITTHRAMENNKTTILLPKLSKRTLRQKRGIRRPKANFVNNEVKVATIYNPDEATEDIILQEHEDEEEEMPKEIYAGIYQPPSEDEIIRQEDLEPEPTPRPALRKFPSFTFPKISFPREIDILIPNAFRFKRQHEQGRPARLAKPKEQYVVELPNDTNDSFDVDADDDMKNYHVFQEKVSFHKVQAPRVRTFQEDMWGFPLAEEMTGNSGQRFSEKVPTMQEQMTIQKTKEHLENYFNKEENFQGNEGKRKPITNVNDYHLSRVDDDKVHAPNSRRTNNCQRGRRSVVTVPSSLKNPQTKLTLSNRNRPEENAFLGTIYMQVGKPFNASAIRINHREKTLQEKYLKQRLQSRRKWKAMLNSKDKRNRRYIPFGKNRKAKTHLKRNKNRDALYENRNNLRMDLSNHLDGNRRLGRSRRGVDLLMRTIDDSVNEIKKGKDLLDTELTPPNKDAFDVVANDDVQINFQHNLNLTNGGEDRFAVRFPNSTNSVWDRIEDEGDRSGIDSGDSLTITVNMTDWLVSDNDSSFNSSGFVTSYDDFLEKPSINISQLLYNKSRKAAEHIQKIARNSEPDLWSKLFDGFTSFVDKVHSKISGCLNYFNS